MDIDEYLLEYEDKLSHQGLTNESIINLLENRI